jgi:hypothetical protein
MCVPPHRNSIGKSALGHKGVIKRAGPGLPWSATTLS